MNHQFCVLGVMSAVLKRYTRTRTPWMAIAMCVTSCRAEPYRQIRHSVIDLVGLVTRFALLGDIELDNEVSDRKLKPVDVWEIVDLLSDSSSSSSSSSVSAVDEAASEPGPE